MQQIHPLKSEKIDEWTIDDDRGEIELRLRWAQRLFEDDLVHIENTRLAVVRIQAWARRLAAVTVSHQTQQERIDFMRMVRVNAVKITNLCRRRIAYQVIKHLRRRLRCAIRIQKRIRIYLARKTFNLKVLQKACAIKIQRVARAYNARELLKRLRIARKIYLNTPARKMQQWVRRWIAQRLTKQLREELDLENSRNYDPKAPPPKQFPVSVWIKTFGKDPDYGLRRNRRITEKIFQRMLQIQYMRLICKPIGIVFVNSYPPTKTPEELLDEKNGLVPLTVREDFVSVFVPSADPRALRRRHMIEICESRPWLGVLHIGTTIIDRVNANYLVTVIQSWVRQLFARRQRRQLVRMHAAFAFFQRRFRRRKEKMHKAARRIMALFHGWRGKKKLRRRRLEMKSALILQCAVRCYHARSKVFNFRSADNLSVLKFSSAVPEHGPEKCLSFKAHAYWMADSPNFAEIRIEMKKRDRVTAFWIMTNTFQTSPKWVVISTVSVLHCHRRL